MPCIFIMSRSTPEKAALSRRIERGGRSVYQNLQAEMKRQGVSKRDVLRALKMDERTLANRFSGKRPFKISEAFAIRNQFFPGASIDYLFGETPETERG